MEYFKKCPKCGRYMTPHLEYRYGIAYTECNCTCGNIEGMEQTGMSTKTTYTGGGASDRTVIR